MATAPLFVVALCELGAPIEVEEEPFAAILGVTTYDARTRATGTLPKIVHQAATMDEALHVAEALRRRGHGAVAFDANDALALDRMVTMRRFSVDGETLFAHDKRPPSRQLSELLVIVRLVLHQHVQRTQTEVEYRYTNRGAVRVAVDRTSGENHAEDALVLFFDGGPPWSLRAREAKYLALGARIRPTVRENFFATAEWLRAVAGSAVYDERFVSTPLVSARLADVRGHGDPALRSDRLSDLRLHALGAWLSRGRHGPYRAAGRREA
ncbi:MAG: hypothetical protein KC657_14800 [Myxococcales bacterium]|nr:hypothetical protein [Myxococcales bacterium]